MLTPLEPSDVLAISLVYNMCNLSPFYENEDNILIELNEFVIKPMSSTREAIDVMDV